MGAFAPAFSRLARRVRGRLMARRALAGMTVGLVLGVGAAALAWWQRAAMLRPCSVGLGVIGAAIGLLWAARRRWSDEQVALYLDRQLGSDEAIATALELSQKDGDSEVRAVVVARAAEALGRTAPPGAWPRVWRRWHGLGLAALAAIGWLSVRALPPGPPPLPPPPGSELVKADELPGLDKVIALSELEARDPAERERLDKLAERARELRKRLREGMERREAQSEIAKLKDDVAAERQRFGSGEERRGLEAAMGKLGSRPELADAQRALGDRDLTRFDEEMAELASKLEEQDRQAAKELLEEAAKAARAADAPQVARALEEQARLLEERARRRQALGELAEAFGEGLSEEAKKALEQMERSGSSAEEQRLADELAEALEQLTDEQRQRLADKMKQHASQIDPNRADAMPLTKEQLEQMAEQLATPEGQRQLAEQLKRWADEPPRSGEAQRQHGLGEAERGLEEAGRGMGMPMPMPGQQGSGQQGGSGQPGSAGDPGQGGISRGGGAGEHDGSTKKIEGDGVRAHARGPLNAGAPNPGTSLGRGPGRAGEVANKQGTGELGTVGPDEVGAVERSDVPEEYREQVRRYFP